MNTKVIERSRPLTISLINASVMNALGYKQQGSIGATQTITASKRETVYEYRIDNIMAISLIRRNFKVISRSLPVGLGIDGLLGLNFFKDNHYLLHKPNFI